MLPNFDLANLIELALFSITMLITALSSYYNGRQTDKMRIQLNDFKDSILKEISADYLRRDFLAVYDARHESLKNQVDMHEDEIADIRRRCEERLEVHRKLAGK
jgi:hypothetical protein